MIRFFLSNIHRLDAFSLAFLVLGYAVLVLIILPFHEFSHAFVAHLCGDDTAKWQGRLTLNPFAHLDLFGTLMLVLVGIGYAKPVPVISRNFHHFKRDMILVALAGPLSNLLMAIAAAGIFKICTLTVTDTALLTMLYLLLIQIIMRVNVSLAVFNLLPIPPLDGSRLWSTLLPGKWAFVLERNSRMITMIMFVALFAGVLDIPLDFINGIFNAGIFALFGL